MDTWAWGHGEGGKGAPGCRESTSLCHAYRADSGRGHQARQQQAELHGEQPGGQALVKVLSGHPVLPPYPQTTHCQHLRDTPTRPNNPPYNTGAFRFELAFSPHHPFEPPRVTLLTSIHHPGVSPDGAVCQPLTSPESWEPGLGWGTWQAPSLMLPPCPAVLQDLLLLLDNPDTERVLRPELARELSERPESFLHQAQEHTRRYAEPRPDTSRP
uniref:UBC core domain-containing protein n=1 Tax=Coturnix japonica TaxID=93934 RepID=A0A8C2U1W4_COTJA